MKKKKKKKKKKQGLRAMREIKYSPITHTDLIFVERMA
jgi:hypothetical protein